jgi:hypothetical protein
MTNRLNPCKCGTNVPPIICTPLLTINWFWRGIICNICEQIVYSTYLTEQEIIEQWNIQNPIKQ